MCRLSRSVLLSFVFLLSSLSLGVLSAALESQELIAPSVAAYINWEATLCLGSAPDELIRHFFSQTGGFRPLQALCSGLNSEPHLLPHGLLFVASSQDTFRKSFLRKCQLVLPEKVSSSDSDNLLNYFTDISLPEDYRRLFLGNGIARLIQSFATCSGFTDYHISTIHRMISHDRALISEALQTAYDLRLYSLFVGLLKLSRNHVIDFADIQLFYAMRNCSPDLVIEIALLGLSNPTTGASLMSNTFALSKDLFDRLLTSAAIRERIQSPAILDLIAEAFIEGDSKEGFVSLLNAGIVVYYDTPKFLFDAARRNKQNAFLGILEEVNRGTGESLYTQEMLFWAAYDAIEADQGEFIAFMIESEMIPLSMTINGQEMNLKAMASTMESEDVNCVLEGYY